MRQAAAAQPRRCGDSRSDWHVPCCVPGRSVAPSIALAATTAENHIDLVAADALAIVLATYFATVSVFTVAAARIPMAAS